MCVEVIYLKAIFDNFRYPEMAILNWGERTSHNVLLFCAQIKRGGKVEDRKQKARLRLGMGAPDA